MTNRLVTTAAIAVLAIAWTPHVSAQVSPHAQIGQPAAAYTDAELKSFAGAMVQMKSINDTYRPKLQTAASPEEQKQFRQTASAEMTRAVETKGMTMRKFHEMLTYARANPEVAERVRQHLLQLR